MIVEHISTSEFIYHVGVFVKIGGQKTEGERIWNQ